MVRRGLRRGLAATEAKGSGDTAADFVPVTLLITAVIFAITAMPTLAWLRERAVPRPLPTGQGYLKAGFGEVLSTLQHATWPTRMESTNQQREQQPTTGEHLWLDETDDFVYLRVSINLPEKFEKFLRSQRRMAAHLEPETE